LGQTSIATVIERRRALLRSAEHFRQRNLLVGGHVGIWRSRSRRSRARCRPGPSPAGHVWTPRSSSACSVCSFLFFFTSVTILSFQPGGPAVVCSNITLSSRPAIKSTYFHAACVRGLTRALAAALSSCQVYSRGDAIGASAN
jgi:hypothetical protein